MSPVVPWPPSALLLAGLVALQSLIARPAGASDAAVEPAAAVRTAAMADLPRLLDTLPAATLESVSGSLPPDHPAGPWLAARLARLEAHQRAFARAEARVEAALATCPASHPARAVLTADLERLRGRGRAVSGRIGALLPLSGPYAGIGRSALLAVRLAAAGSPGQAPFELVVEDTGGDAQKAAAAVERLVRTHGVTGIVGPVGARESQAAALAAERLEVTIVSLTGAPGVTGQGPFSFRHRLTRAGYARSLAQYALDRMGLRTFAILYPHGDYGYEMRDAFWRAVERSGGEIRAAEGYSLRATQFNTPIKRLVGRDDLKARTPDERWAQINRKARDPAMRVPPIVDFEAIFIADTADRARAILPFLLYWDVELRTHPEQNAADLAPKYGGEVPPLVQVLGTSAFNNADFAARIGEPGRNSVFLDEFLPDAPEAVDFVSRFQASNKGAMPDALAAHAYDAARMLATAAAGLTDRAEVRRRLLALRDFPGVVGRSHFNGDGEIDLRLNVLTIGVDGTVTPRWEEQGYGAPDTATP
jgi:branched-chain amino acid transport system substrate-binding protein